jgi:hypothetical protein
MKADLAALLHACDGAHGGTCNSECKEALRVHFTSCVHGYLPALISNGFRSTIIQQIFSACKPSERNTVLPLHVQLLLEANLDAASLRETIATFDWAVETASLDPELFRGYEPRITYNITLMGSTFEDGAATAARLIHDGGLDRFADVVIGPFGEDPALGVQAVLTPWQIPQICFSGRLKVGDPRTLRDRHPYLVASVVSGTKVVFVLEVILKECNASSWTFLSQPDDASLKIALPMLKEGGLHTALVEYVPDSINSALMQTRRLGVRAIGVSDSSAASLSVLFLGMFNAQMYGRGWIIVSNMMEPATVVGKSNRAYDLWEAMQGMLYIAYPDSSDFPLELEARQELARFATGVTFL